MINSIDIDLQKRTAFKRINFEHPMNKTIAHHLSTYYGFRNPLVEFEVSILEELAPYDIAPRVLKVSSDGYLMTYVGRSLREQETNLCSKSLSGKLFNYLLKRKGKDSNISKDSAYKQVTEVLEILRSKSIRHNDIYNENIMVDDDGRIRLIDFTFANWNGVVGLGDLFPELITRHDFIFCARMTDETLYQVIKPINFESLKKEILSDIESAIPSSRGATGAHIAPGFIYHALPFSELSIPHHRTYSDVRIKKILSHLTNKELYGLDLGCSVGAISFNMQKYGKKMTGVDHDAQSIVFAQKIDNWKGYGVHFRHDVINMDFADRMENVDFVIWLSNWMWIAKELGVTKAQQILHAVSKKTRVLFFDTAQGGTDKADSYQLSNAKAVNELLRKCTDFSNILDLGPSEEGYHRRNLFVCK